jgi:hypothetical protein
VSNDIRGKLYIVKQTEGAKGGVCGPVDMHLADECVLTKHRKCNVFLPSLMHACPHHGPWETCIWLSQAKAERVSSQPF